MLRNLIAKYRWIILFWVVFALFWGVTDYFYFQHRVVVRSYPLYRECELGDLHVVIGEVALENFSPKYDFPPPWFAWLINHSPVRLRQPIMEACAFYRKPYVFYPDKGILKVQGWVTSTAQDFARIDHAERENMIDVDVQNYHQNSRQSLNENMSNIVYFETASYAPPQLQGFDIAITDKRTGQVVVIPVIPNWERTVYTFANPQPSKPDFGMNDTMFQFISLIRQNRLDAAAAYVLPERRQSFPWPNLNNGYWKLAGASTFPWYEGRYLGYDSVYSYNIDFTGDPAAETAIARRKIYFIDRDGRWQIIDASPVTVRTAP